MMPRADRRLPERTCVQCGSAGMRGSFLRIAGRPGSGWEPDPGGRMPGRGIYLCRTAECVEGFARRIRTPKGASRWKMGVNGVDLAAKVSAWWAAETRK
ncbi:MAG TPA: YlxR family protein [Candidatus Limnocylindrales bacterium]|nr:YlxR family protein [Candidatus Limnocylindrales bacterium]